MSQLTGATERTPPFLFYLAIFLVSYTHAFPHERKVDIASAGNAGAPGATWEVELHKSDAAEVPAEITEDWPRELDTRGIVGRGKERERERERKLGETGGESLTQPLAEEALVSPTADGQEADDFNLSELGRHGEREREEEHDRERQDLEGRERERTEQKERERQRVKDGKIQKELEKEMKGEKQRQRMGPNGLQEERERFYYRARGQEEGKELGLSV